MVIRVSQHALDPFYRLRLEFVASHGRDGLPTAEQVVTGIAQGTLVGLLLDDHQGYALFHLADYHGARVVWLDELYVVPAARKQGRLQEFADWLKEYCRYNGLASILGTAFTAAEGEPFVTHLGAEPVCMVLRVNAATLAYKSTQQIKRELKQARDELVAEAKETQRREHAANGVVYDAPPKPGTPRKKRNVPQYAVTPPAAKDNSE